MEKATEVHEVKLPPLTGLFGAVVLTLEDGRSWRTEKVSAGALEGLLSNDVPFGQRLSVLFGVPEAEFDDLDGRQQALACSLLSEQVQEQVITAARKLRNQNP